MAHAPGGALPARVPRAAGEARLPHALQDTGGGHGGHTPAHRAPGRGRRHSLADILLVLEPLGVGLEFTRGEGPHIARPVRSAEDVSRLAPVDVPASVGFVFETVRLVRKALADRVPL